MERNTEKKKERTEIVSGSYYKLRSSDKEKRKILYDPPRVKINFSIRDKIFLLSGGGE